MKNIKVRIISVSLLAAAFFLSACQPTPDKPIINAGDDTELNDKIEATAIPTPETPEKNLSSIYNFPTSYKDSFECIDTDVNFNVDAKVIVPDVQSVSVIEIEPTVLPGQFMKSFTEKLHPGLVFYHIMDIMTKSEIKAQIDEYEKDLALPYDEFVKNFAERLGETDEESARRYYEQTKYSLEKYKEMLVNATDDIEPELADFEYHPIDYWETIIPEALYTLEQSGETMEEFNDGRGFIDVYADTDDGFTVHSHLEARLEGDKYCTFTYHFSPKGESYLSPFYSYPMNLSESEISEMGGNVIDAMGLTDEMMLTDISYSYGDGSSSFKPKKGQSPIKYTLEYRRGFNGLNVGDVKIDNEYNYVNGNEKIKIEISHDMVIDIEYTNPYDIVRVENENVELISFEQAYEAFKRQAAVEYTKGTFADEYTMNENGELIPDDEGVDSASVTIETAELVMVRVPIKDGGYRYLPAWQFKGWREVKDCDGETSTFGKNRPVTFMTINAVDGTRIAGQQ